MDNMKLFLGLRKKNSSAAQFFIYLNSIDISLSTQQLSAQKLQLFK